jgi:hypothetical protein
MKGDDERSKTLLCEFAPFDVKVATSLGVSVPQSSVTEFTWYTLFPGGHRATDPDQAAIEISVASWTCFQTVSLYSWARVTLGFEDESVEAFKACHERLGQHVRAHLRMYPGELSWFSLVAKVYVQINGLLTDANCFHRHWKNRIPLHIPRSLVVSTWLSVPGSLRRLSSLHLSFALYMLSSRGNGPRCGSFFYISMF